MRRLTIELPRHGRDSTDDLAEKMAAYVKAIAEDSEAIMDSIISKAMELPEFDLLKTIPGIADITATRLIAEIGDISAYPKADSLIAHTGLDPAVMQSGQMTGEHMHITKKGNSHLRATLYVAVSNMIMTKADNMITRYVLKKKNSGLSYKGQLSLPVVQSCCV